MYNKYSDMSIRGLYELKFLWENDEIFSQVRAMDPAHNFMIELKQEIRRRNKKPASRVIASWGAYDSWTEVVACPSWVKNAEDAKEFFEEELDLPPIRSMYDCTGRAFVSGYKIGKRCNQWVVYVHKGLDV